MSEFAESLKRLYAQRLIDSNKLRDLLNMGRITQEEYRLIIRGE